MNHTIRQDSFQDTRRSIRHSAGRRGPTHGFASLSLMGSGLARRPKVCASKRKEGYSAKFDSTTLWLDAVWCKDHVRLICPSFNNLDRHVRSAQFQLDGQDVQACFKAYKRHTVVRLPALSRPERVSVSMEGWIGETPVNQPRPDVFAGKKVLLTMSRNNDLDWIRDWVNFHVHHHRADTVLFIDNGSDAYSLSDVNETLRGTGIERFEVLHTPLPFGPRGIAPYANSELFLQTGVYNAAKWRFLSAARAVLTIDIDELVVCSNGSIFDAAVDSAFGYVEIPGHWVSPEPGRSGTCEHGYHGWRESPLRPCPRKWCMVPGGRLGGFEWRAHTLERLPFARAFVHQRANFFHCRSVTTCWKGPGRMSSKGTLVPDYKLRNALRNAGLGWRC